MKENSEIPSDTSDPARRAAPDPLKEVSAATVGRMLGLATSSELKLLEGKLDLIATKLTNLTVKLEKVISTLSNFPTGSDLERIDVQIGMLRSLITEGASGKQAAPASLLPKKPLNAPIPSSDAKAAAPSAKEEAAESTES